MANEKSFYLVWRAPDIIGSIAHPDRDDEKEGRWDTKPRIQHSNYKTAEEEADRLARQTQKSYYILKAVGKIESEFTTKPVAVLD